ncbi:MAG TPA: hypothetical protein VGB45_05140 [Abditibacterium sp.]|jgi:hypothetical protein
MSLNVTVCRINAETGEEEDLDFSRPIGAENRRFDFYGSPAVKSLGLKLIAQLEKEGIDIGYDDLEEFEKEIKIMQENLTFIMKDCNRDEEDCASRLRLILRAIEYAKLNQAHVQLG